jgi:magnesium-transporting ATPase (P-type)
MSKAGNQLKAAVNKILEKETEKVPASLQKENAELRKLEKKFNKEVGHKKTPNLLGKKRKGLTPELILDMLDQDSENSKEELSMEEIDIKISVRVEKKLTDRNLISDACAKKDHLIDLLNYVLLTLECVSVNRLVTKSDSKSAKSLTLENRALTSMLLEMSFRISLTKDRQDIQGQGNGKTDLTNASTYRISSRFGVISHYDVICCNSYSQNRGRISIIARDNQKSNQYILIVLGEDSCFRSNLLMKEKEHNVYKILVTNYKIRGLKRMVVACRTLTETEVITFLNTAQLIGESSRNQLEAFQTHVNELEMNLRFLGCFGIKDIVREDAKELVKNLQKADVKINIMSGDVMENCLTTAKELELSKANFNNTSEFFKLSSETEKECTRDFERIIANLKDSLQDFHLDRVEKMKEGEKATRESVTRRQSRRHSTIMETNRKKDGQEQTEADGANGKPFYKTLIFSGRSIDVIKGNSKLEGYLRMLFLFVDCSIGYNMQPHQKEFLVAQMRKQGFVVMAVGDGFNDMSMLNTANVGVQLYHPDLPLVVADIVVDNLKGLNKLLFVDGHRCSSFSILLRNYSLWFAVFMLTVYISVLLSSGFSKAYTANQFVSPKIFNIVVIPLSLLFTFPYTDWMLLRYPALYIERKAVEHNNARILSVLTLSAIAEGAFVSFMFSMYASTIKLPSGASITDQLLDFWLTEVIMIISAFKSTFLVQGGYEHLIKFGIFALTFGTYLLSYLMGTPLLDLVSLKEIFSVVPFYTTFLATLLPVIFAEYLIEQLLVNLLLFPATKLIARKLKEENFEYFRKGANKRIADYIYSTSTRYRVKLVSAIKASFVDDTVNTPIIQRIIGIDYFNIAIPIHPVTQAILDISDQRKFSNYQLPGEVANYRLYLMTALAMSFLEFLYILVFFDIRGNVLFDSMTAYLIIIFGALLSISYIKPSMRVNKRLSIVTFFLIVAMLIGSAFLDLSNGFQPQYNQVSRFMLGSLSISYIEATLSAIALDVFTTLQ